jgi:peptidoglycan hydrolase-like protein with peptidoglycan-binding domain
LLDKRTEKNNQNNMETLAYLHIALAYEAPIDATHNILFSENLKFFEWLKRQKLANQVRLYLLSLIVILGLSGIAGEALAQTLRLGVRSPDVTFLQQRLRELGYFYRSPTGVFGTETQDAVIRFQRANQLSPDGIVGAETQAVLFGRQYPSQSFDLPPSTGRQYPSQSDLLPPPPSFPPYSSSINEDETFSTAERNTDYVTLQPGAYGPQVRELQRELRQRGYNPGPIDGVYGAQTARAVRQFQREEGLRIDGVAGTETLTALGLFSPAEKNRYVVVVPGNEDTLRKVRDVLDFSDVSLRKSRLGNYVNAGAFSKRSLAESRSYLLRSRGLDARVVRR